MKSTYAAPAATTRGDIVRSTLSGKDFGDELVQFNKKSSGGCGLSFGL